MGESMTSFAKRAAALCGFLLFGAQAQAQGVADFYKGKSVDLYIGYSAGGGYDVYARLVARHMGKHIPGNPTVVPRNMEGAGSLRLVNWLYNIGAKDGLAIGAVSRGAAFDPLFGSPGAQFDAEKLNWIGSANNEAADSGGKDGGGTGRRAAVGAAGLEGHVEGGAPGEFGRRKGSQSLHLGVGLAGALVPATGKDAPVFNDHGADGWVGASGTDPFEGFLQRCPHKLGVLHGSVWGPF
jgi:hypothetical protein